MRINRRSVVTIGAAIMAAGFVFPLQVSASPAGAVTSAVAHVVDDVGDMLSDGESDFVPPEQADLIAASADYRPEGLVLTAKAARVTDPLTERAWRAQDTYVSWLLDTGNDGTEDFEARYRVESGKLSGAVYRVDGNDDPPKSSCGLSAATFDATAGYTAVVDPKCLGNPRSVSYQATLYYQSDPKNETTAAWDLAPDDFAGPVALAQTVSGAPAAPGTNTPATREPDGATGSAPQAPLSAAPTTPSPVSPLPNGSETRTSGDGGLVTQLPANPDATRRGLARTGVGDGTMRLAWFAAGMILIGAGLRFANQGKRVARIAPAQRGRMVQAVRNPAIRTYRPRGRNG